MIVYHGSISEVKKPDILPELIVIPVELNEDALNA